MRQILLLLLLIFTMEVFSQDFYQVSGSKIFLDNGKIFREINIINDSIYSSELSVSAGADNYIFDSREFSFLINDRLYDGYSGWELLSTNTIEDETGGRGVKILLTNTGDQFTVRLELNYLLYPGYPIIRKWINFTNEGSSYVKLEAVNIEDMNTRFSHVSSVVYENYGRMKHLGQFTGNWDDPVVVVHEITQRKGMALGNEAVCVLKRTAYHTLENNIEIGLTHPEDDFPFRKWIAPGETWESPKTFVCLYAGYSDGFQVIDNEVNEFMIRFMRPRIVRLKSKPTFVYNTWNPFRTFISDSLIRDVAKAASECGIQEFILDDGWEVNHSSSTSVKSWGNNYGDWLVDTLKFPGGLKPTFDYIRSLGMKPGLWISICSATTDAKVFKDHPEWFIINKDQQLGNVHMELQQTDFHSSCFGTGWTDYIKDVILNLVSRYGLAYAKLDFSVVTSAYINDNTISGCYSTEHPLHKDHNESFTVIYQQVLKLFDELHQEAPDLFIDCTFETAGKLQLMDYAIAQHAEGNWLSNFEEYSPVGPLRVRQMAWWRSPALPAGSLVIGNQQMDDPEFEFVLKSLIGTLPIVLGDPRELPREKRAMIKSWSQWMQEMQGKYDYMSYRKDLPGFGEPKEGAWDGWQRINFQTKQGGIFGVFRQGAAENTRTVVLKDLDPVMNYAVRQAPSGTEVYRASGEKLMKEGIPVKIDKAYDGAIYEVGVINSAGSPR
jgi:alpha-galactosidase